MSKKKTKKKNHFFINLILLICIAIVIYSGSKLFVLLKGYYEGAAAYKDVRKECTSVRTEGKTAEEESGFFVDFKKLLGRNADAVAWIRFDAPEEISYPVVQGVDNREYLWTNFDEAYNRGGTIFVETENNPDFKDRNTIIYGHNMWDKTMFSRLDMYHDKAFYEAHPYFYIYTPDGHEITYQILMTGKVDDDCFLYNIDFENDEAFYKYLEKSQAASLYNTGAEINVGSHVVTLSTCMRGRDPKNTHKRYVVQGIAVRDREVRGGIPGYKAVRKKDRK